MSRLAQLFPSLGYAPLLPVAGAVTAGIVADRYLFVPLPFSILGGIVCLALWAFDARMGRLTRAGLYLWAGCAGLGAAYHHAWRQVYPADDIGHFTKERAFLVRIRATFAEEPVRIHHPRQNPLISLPRKDPSSAILEMSALEQDGTWLPVSGKVRFYVDGELPDLHAGDEIECVGWLARPESPANPGEWDRAGMLQDQRIRAEIHVRKTADGVVRIAEGWRSSLFGWLAVLRGWGQRSLQTHLPAESSGVAGALLLGDGSTMTREDWEKYIRTGVIHVLAISGQHLVVLAAFLWLLARVLGIRQRRAALFVAGLLLAYALLTGGRPSAMRAAVMVCAVCGGILLRQSALPANTFVLAWLVVLALQRGVSTIFSGRGRPDLGDSPLVSDAGTGPPGATDRREPTRAGPPVSRLAQGRRLVVSHHTHPGHRARAAGDVLAKSHLSGGFSDWSAVDPADLRGPARGVSLADGQPAGKLDRVALRLGHGSKYCLM